MTGLDARRYKCEEGIHSFFQDSALLFEENSTRRDFEGSMYDPMLQDAVTTRGYRRTLDLQVPSQESDY